MTALTPTRMPTSKDRISFPIDDDLKRKFRKLAEKEKRTMSNLALFLISQYVESAIAEGRISEDD